MQAPYLLTKLGTHLADEEDLAAGMRNLRDLELALEGQHQRRAELEEYMSRLHEHTGEDGAKLVELPRSYAVMVEEMIRQQRGEHQSLQGWLGPHRCTAACSSCIINVTLH